MTDQVTTVTIMQPSHHMAMANLSWRPIIYLDQDDANWCYPLYPDHIFSHNG